MNAANVGAFPGSGTGTPLTATGRVAEVVYAGPITRFVVDLDAGPRLVVVQQNQQTSSADVAAMRDRPVRLSWRPEHVVSVPSPGAGPE
jgi:putative spermidine/putrescine transport system ATP-binding protein